MLGFSPIGSAPVGAEAISSAASAIVISPAAVLMNGRELQQFSASENVTWTASPGEISASGQYLAPSAIGQVQTATITATSVADPSKSATATVSIRARAADSWGLLLRDQQLTYENLWPELKAPTPEQAASGNYLMDRMRLYGLRIFIENPAGSIREWAAEDGTSGSQQMPFAYGYIDGTRGNDGDELDCFIGPVPLNAEQAFVVNQFIGGQFDEHKIMLGFGDQDAAAAGYLGSYEQDWTGMGSCIACSIPQLKWWIANGDKSVPLEYGALPNMEEKEVQKVLWDSAGMPLHANLEQVMYGLRAHDGHAGLLCDPLTISDILEDSDGVLAMDALVVPFARLEQRMTLMSKVLERTGGAVKVAAMQVSDPFTQRGTTNVAVVYELTDGQTISVFFHNPDVTPKKITPSDEMVSWKWMLNKKDITVAVAPERGRDLDIRTVAARIMRLAETNSARFAKTNATRAAKLQTIAELKTELETKEATLSDLTRRIEVARVERENDGQPDAAKPVAVGAHKVEIIQGTMDEPGGYSVDGRRYVGEEHEALVDEAKQMAQSTGKAVEDALASIIPHDHLTAPAPEPVEPSPAPAAAPTLDVDGIKAVVADIDPMLGVDHGAHWLIMNAARPLMGTETMSGGEFLAGRFYAAIDPSDYMADAYLAENKRLDASMVFIADEATQTIMALNTISPQYVGAYLEMDEGERNSALRGFVEKLNGRTYGELKALAAKGMPTAAAPRWQDKWYAQEDAAKGTWRVAGVKNLNPISPAYLSEGEAESAAAAYFQTGEFPEPNAEDVARRAAAENAAFEAGKAAFAADEDRVPPASMSLWEQAQWNDGWDMANAASADAAREAQAAATRQAQEDQEAADGDFLALAAQGNVDFYDKAVTDRLAELAKKYTDPEGAYLDMVQRAKVAAKAFFVREFSKKVA